MITVLEETLTPLQRGGKNLYRRVYLVEQEWCDMPTDAAPGSIAIVLCSENLVQTRILFPNGQWGTL